MIDCQEASRLLHEYLDQELSEENVGKIEEHIHKCEKCIGHLDFDKALRLLLKKQSIQHHISQELKARILKKLEF